MFSSMAKTKWRGTLVAVALFFTACGSEPDGVIDEMSQFTPVKEDLVGPGRDSVDCSVDGEVSTLSIVGDVIELNGEGFSDAVGVVEYGWSPNCQVAVVRSGITIEFYSAVDGGVLRPEVEPGSSIWAVLLDSAPVREVWFARNDLAIAFETVTGTDPSSFEFRVLFQDTIDVDSDLGASATFETPTVEELVTLNIDGSLPVSVTLVGDSENDELRSLELEPVE